MAQSRPSPKGNGAKENKQANGSGYQFGTFKGVYTPSLLTILGVVMYLRFGWVLGNVGLFGALLIVTLATAITILTAMSVSALVTNMKIGKGGVYFILSRALGVEAGAAVGLPLFLAKALGVSFYIAGFSESIVNLFPHLSPVTVGIATLIVLTGLAYLSANLALRAQFIILTLVGLSLISFFAGAFQSAAAVSTSDASALSFLHSPVGLGEGIVSSREPFWVVFAVFFPAVTGIEAGMAMSGDLKNPAKSLPWGTLGAVLTSYVIYMAIPIFLTQMVENRQLLLTNLFIMRDIALWGDLVVLGLWGAALSSAIGSLLGAPRVLQALAQDKMVPQIFGKGFGPGNDPRAATVACFFISLCGILAGGLNVLGPVLTLFFLTAYGLLNLSAALEGLIGSPSWRPEFRVPWPLSLAGALGCLVVAFMISPGATFLATLVSGTLYYLLRRRHFKAYWGDMRYGILTLLARFSIYRMAQREPNVRTWRPNILVLSGSPAARWYLIALADAISHGKGFLTVAAVVPEKGAGADRVENLGESIEEYLKKRRVPALVKLHTADDVLEGAQSLIKTYGFGPLEPNTVLLGETEKAGNVTGYVRLIQLVYETRRNLIIVRESDHLPSFTGELRIDIWWSHTSHNASLMLALAHLLQTSPEWIRARLVLKTIVEDEEDREEAFKGLTGFIQEGRVGAEVEVLVRENRDVFETIRTASARASIVFIGIRSPEPDETTESYSAYYEQLLKRTDGFPSIAMVMGAEDIEFDRIFTSSR